MKYILIILLFISCGTRKSNVNNIDVNVDSISVNNKRILRQNSTFNDILSIKPFDTSKPIEINGIKYYNASITYDKSKLNNFEVENDFKSVDLKRNTSLKNKEVERKDNTLLYLGGLFIICLFIFLWFYLPHTS